ncbi:DUF2252 domain-containing protein [Erythrobacter sp. 3-20A1M]|uniref:DUF2252 domain-containing protein n=1 Tax=Erythrobacter sp. 3-20A1M TaxID=2653850 RepID=UPI001BFC1F25|nr:DUF2252 family protein [Erythrobacter sp. 3-20A1M]QWC57244.1 DUF2252 domain-containing protein [Erythrobacter sp. 3-20A1M]
MAGKQNGNGDAEDTAGGDDHALSPGKPGSRHDAYAQLADRFASGAAIPLPTFLHGQARREHVRACILEDHATRIDARAQGTQEKFEELAGDLYKYFRGTALGFYRDMAGMDAARPKVLLLGDVHPGNFGVMPNADNVPIFSVNDFDEVAYGPYSWDLKRGAAGFILAAKCAGGLKRKQRRRVAKCFAKGYIAGMKHFADGADPNDDVFRMDNAPPIICDLFDDAMENRADWLADDHQNETRKGFSPSSSREPVTSRRDEFQGYLDELAERNGIEPGGRFGELRVKDVAHVYGKGCASLGLTRFHIMIEGPEKDGTDDIIVEFKLSRLSALDGLAPHGDLDTGARARRVAEGQRIHIPNGDVFYGAVEIDGESYMTRERAPFRDDIDQSDLDYDGWRDYAHACGRALALAHARSDDAGAIDYDIEPAILEDMAPHHLFIHDVACFAEEAVDRMKRDWKAYRKDYRRGAFTRRFERYG